MIAYDPFLTEERAADIGVDKVELDELLRRADFITLHTPLTDQTRGIIDADAIAKMKEGVRIINCARGGLVVEADLLEGLKSGHVAGAALDVFAEEPAKENPLFGLPQVVATPHLGASTEEAQVNVAIQVAEQMSDFLLTGAVTNAINMPSMTAEEAPRLRPYMRLAEQMGSFAGQITKSAIKAVTLEFCGHAATLNTKPLTAVVLKGLLAPQMESVNMVSAPVVARDRDIDVTETVRDSCGSFQTLMRVIVTADSETRAIGGTIFGVDQPRIVEVRGIAIEAEIGPHMLYIVNDDKPGFVGQLGKALGDVGLNIATFSLGREAPGGLSIALLSVDGEVPEEVLETVRAIPQVTRVEALNF